LRSPPRLHFRSAVLTCGICQRAFAKNLLFSVLVPGTVGVIVPVWAFEHPPAQVSVAAILGGLALIIGASMYAWCVWDFAVVGHGTPAPIDPPRNLVVRGLYKYTRNPMYVGVLCIIVAWALLFRSMTLAIYGASVAASFHLFVRLYEEPHLKKVFGASYEHYCSEVRRWLPIPKQQSAA
jgi:protein-S-isoprenylcysteine O-methyltransferase Ste14